MPIGGILAVTGAAFLAASGDLERLEGGRIGRDRVGAEVARLLEAGAVPGLSIALINDNRIVYTAGFGVRDTASGAAVDADTVFGGLSFSKTVFAYLVMKLVDRGDLELDASLAQYLERPLPDYEFYRDLAGDDRYLAVTARMALSHTTGWPNWRWFTPENELSFWFDPGRRFSYSGEGFAYLQLVVEEITGRPLADLAQELVFEPLGMKRSSFLWEERFEGNFAASHDDYGRPIGKERKDEAQAAGSIQLTASDYARFLLAVARGEGLRPSSARELLTAQVALQHRRMFGPGLRESTDAHAASELSWGLGFGLVRTPHGWAHFHTGNDRGCSNYMIAYPGRGLAVVLLGNSNRLEGVAHELTRLLIGDTSSPFEFLGYEPFDSPVNEWIRALRDDGLSAAQSYYDSLDAAERRSAGLDEEAAFTRAGADLLGHERFALATGFFALYRERFPKSVQALDAGADAELGLGRYDAAVRLLQRGVELAGSETEHRARLVWRLDWVRALASPYEVPTDRLERYAGAYGTRLVTLRDGALYYLREGLADATERRLIPLSDDTFVFSDLDWFRLRFETDSSGKSVKAIGLYQDGRTDETLRTP